MTLLVDDPRALAASGTSGTALRWGLAAVTVATAYATAIWLALALPDPMGAQGELQDAVMIELEPLTAIEEAPPPAPEPELVEEAVAEPPPEPPVEEAAPEPPPPEPVVEEPPPEPVLPEEIVPPEPVVEEPPPVPEPVEEPEPLPEPTTEEVVPDLVETNSVAAAVINPPIPQLRPPAPRPVEKVERKPRVEKPRRKPEPVKKPDRPKKVAEARPPTPRSSAPRSDAPAASRSASAPRVSTASWKAKVNSHIRRFKRTVSTRSRNTGTTRLSITIDDSGRVNGVRVISSSGSADFDAEALALVRRASPFPAPPQGGLTLTLPVKM